MLTFLTVLSIMLTGVLVAVGIRSLPDPEPQSVLITVVPVGDNEDEMRHIAYWQIDDQWYKQDVSDGMFDPNLGTTVDIETAPFDELELLAQILEERQ